MRNCLCLLFLICLGLCTDLAAQQILLVEKTRSANTQKFYPGDYLQYRLYDDRQWYEGYLYELREDQQLVVFEDRFVPIETIRTLRQGRPGAQRWGAMLSTFGIAWSGFAAIGTATDGDPETNYQWSDAAVTGVSTGLGLLLPAIAGTRKIRLGEKSRYRLRIVDITF